LSKKIHKDENGEVFVSMVPDAYFVWCKGKDAAEIGRTMQFIFERAEAGDEDALKDYQFLATDEHMDAWEEGRSVTSYKQ
jgi:hypothetical protein